MPTKLKSLQWQNGNVHTWGYVDIPDAQVTHRLGSVNISLFELRPPEEIKSKATPNSEHAHQENCLQLIKSMNESRSLLLGNCCSL